MRLPNMQNKRLWIADIRICANIFQFPINDKIYCFQIQIYGSYKMVFAYWTRSIMDQKWHSAFGQKSTHQQFSCLGQKNIHQQFVQFWQKKTHQEFVRVGQRTHINNLWDLVSGATNSVCWPKIPDHIKHKEHKPHIFFSSHMDLWINCIQFAVFPCGFMRISAYQCA